MPADTYRDLEVWKKSMDLVEAVYRITREIPSSERYGITSQLQRAVVSVPTNIAEGYARSHRGEYVQHLSIARGSLAEVETLLTIVARLRLVARERVVEIWPQTQTVGKMLRRLMESLQREPRTRNTRGSQTRNPKPETPIGKTSAGKA